MVTDAVWIAELFTELPYSKTDKVRVLSFHATACLTSRLFSVPFFFTSWFGALVGSSTLLMSSSDGNSPQPPKSNFYLLSSNMLSTPCIQLKGIKINSVINISKII
ncbi:hypothetical protein TNIN_14131 [Trichonephila inaurata madagascariensis]|uniref:Uncharacterized protein n=1 Tax=Trichonephila inaurata madagascariensis TaxID=2747483 RepID=A0A8X6YTF1_9ARAC|nr:hypothetical protein TNIN_14131 [Trichonephila inaurata madagascariensis]